MAVEKAVLGMYYMLIVVEYGRYGLLCRQKAVEWAVLSLVHCHTLWLWGKCVELAHVQ